MQPQLLPFRETLANLLFDQYNARTCRFGLFETSWCISSVFGEISVYDAKGPVLEFLTERECIFLILKYPFHAQVLEGISLFSRCQKEIKLKCVKFFSPLSPTNNSSFYETKFSSPESSYSINTATKSH